MKSTYLAMLTIGSVLAGGLAFAGSQSDPGVSDTEIKIGNTMPYSGPASAWGMVGKSEAAYFAMINEQGGVNGRKINFISRDDGYSPPKTVEMVRKLVEEDQVLLLFQTLGTASNAAVQGYLNERNIRSCLSQLVPTGGMIPKTIHGLWVGSLAIGWKRASTAGTS
jgi:branched-chain amino acid transport system substrate-binding protein